MSDYTIISIDDVENSAEASGLAPGLGARLRAKISHPGQEELLVIVKGDGRVKHDDVKDVRERDVIRIGAGVTHGIEAGANGLELIAFGAPGLLRGDAEMDQGWWADEG